VCDSDVQPPTGGATFQQAECDVSQSVSALSSQLIPVGQDVFSRYMDGFYPATITAHNEDGTYGIRFFDGLIVSSASSADISMDPSVSAFSQAFVPRAPHSPGLFGDRELSEASRPSAAANTLSEMPGSVEFRGSDSVHGITHTGFDFAAQLRSQLRAGGIIPCELNRDNIEDFAHRLNRGDYSNASGVGIDVLGVGSAVTGPPDAFANSIEGLAHHLHSIGGFDASDGGIEGVDTANRSMASSSNAQSRCSSMSLS
jgi:hypothetical protein